MQAEEDVTRQITRKPSEAPFTSHQTTFGPLARPVPRDLADVIDQDEALAKDKDRVNKALVQEQKHKL